MSLKIKKYGEDDLKRPTYYLWKNDFSREEDYKKVKERYARSGFRVVTYVDGQREKDIHEGLKTIIKNHYCCEFL